MRSDCLFHDLFRLPAAAGQSCNTTVVTAQVVPQCPHAVAERREWEQLYIESHQSFCALLASSREMSPVRSNRRKMLVASAKASCGPAKALSATADSAHVPSCCSYVNFRSTGSSRSFCCRLLSIRFRSRKSIGQTFTVLEWVFTDPVRRPLQPQLQSKLLNGGTVEHVHISALPEGFNFFEKIARDWNGVWHGTQNIRVNLCRNGSDFQSGLTASAVRNRRGVQPFGIAILPRSAARAAWPGRRPQGTTSAAG